MDEVPYQYWDESEHNKIENNFTYHPPISDQYVRYESIREYARFLAEKILGFCPPSREKSLALTKLEEAVFWANASIARNEKLGEE